MKMGILAAAVLALVALYFVFGSEMLSPASTDSITSSGTQAGSETRKGSVKSPGGATPSAGERGQAPDEGQGPGKAVRPAEGGVDNAVLAGQPKPGMSITRTGGAPVTYTRHDGVVVRDHRANPSEPDLDGYVVLPPAASKVKPNTLIEVRKVLREPMQACIDANAAGAEEGAKLQLLLLTSIASENLSVDKASVKISGLASEDALRACVIEAVVGHKQAVAGAQDVNIHRMVFRYAL